jgi:hypothetical protein
MEPDAWPLKAPYSLARCQGISRLSPLIAVTCMGINRIGEYVPRRSSAPASRPYN